MSIVSGSIPNFISGVSQQPFSLRLASQAESVKNAILSVVEGQGKRPNSIHLAKIINATGYDHAFLHTINRDENERYVVVATSGALKVFDIDGVQKTVNLLDSSGTYLTCSTPDTDLAAITVADYTFIVNKTIEVALDVTTQSNRTPEAVVWVRAGNYNQTYTITLGGTAYSYTTSPSDASTIGTNYIASQLSDRINNGNRATGYFDYTNQPADGDTFTLNGTTWTYRANLYGILTYAGQPTAGDTITLNGKVITYVAAGATADQINIGANLAATLAATTAKLNAHADAEISKCVYSDDGATKLTIKYKSPGTIYTWTLAENSTNISASASALTITNADKDLAVGLTLSSTISSTADSLNASADAQTLKCTYTARGNRLDISYDTGGTGGNSFTLAETSSYMSRSAATLSGGAAAGYVSVLYGSTLHIVKSGNADFTIIASDGAGDTSLVAVKDTIQTFDLLPPVAPDGFQVEITGSDITGFDNYYVQYDSSASGGAGKGIWNEIAEPGRVVALDPHTMPHALIRQMDGTFTVEMLDWDQCQAGDTDTCPDPSFVGFTLADIFFFKNRLGFLSDENVILSEAGNFFNFYRQTATDVLDDDPIDIAALHTKISILKHAVPFDESLLLFSALTQFTLKGQDFLTPKTTSCSQTTEFETSTRCKPIGLGKFLYFTSKRGNYTAVHEYYVAKDGATSSVNDASEITGHVPKLIEGEVYKIAASSVANIQVYLSDTVRNKMYIYQFYFSEDGTEKVQSAWQYWEFGSSDVILNADFIDTDLFIVIQRSDGVHLEKLRIEPALEETDLDFPVLLDRRVTPSQCTVGYNAGTNLTTITLPYSDTDTLKIVATGSNASYPGGYLIPCTRVNGTTYTITGNHQTEWWVGKTYEHRMTLSPLQVRQQSSGGGLVATSEGRLQIRKFELNYANTGYFRIEVTPYRRDTYTNTFSGFILGSSSTPVGERSMLTGKYRFSVMANNLNVAIDFINDSHFPANFLNGDWEGHYVVRSEKVD